MKDKYVKALTEIMNSQISNDNELEISKNHLINILIRIYGENCKQIEQINKIKYTEYISSGSVFGPRDGGGGNNLKDCIINFNGAIRTFIAEIDTFGIPERVASERTGGGININLNQQQSLNINIEILINNIKEELTGKQYKELKEIINSAENPITKKNKIIDKLKSFGGDVLSNVIANILTNPQVYSIL